MKKDISRELWDYMSEHQKDLIKQGFHLHDDVLIDKRYFTYDYSFIVFPFAKAYEGFLKQVFLDMGFITEREYFSNHFRVGKVLSPSLSKRLGRRSVYLKLYSKFGREISELVWQTWKVGRNEVFHYYPHNIKCLSLSEAEKINETILYTMEKVVQKLKISKKISKRNR